MKIFYCFYKTKDCKEHSFKYVQVIKADSKEHAKQLFNDKYDTEYLFLSHVLDDKEYSRLLKSK